MGMYVVRKKTWVEVMVLMRPKMKNTLKKLAFEIGKNQSEVVREALLDYFRKHGVNYEED